MHACAAPLALEGDPHAFLADPHADSEMICEASDIARTDPAPWTRCHDHGAHLNHGLLYWLLQSLLLDLLPLLLLLMLISCYSSSTSTPYSTSPLAANNRNGCGSLYVYDVLARVPTANMAKHSQRYPCNACQPTSLDKFATAA
jgi:hypothetical protein